MKIIVLPLILFSVFLNAAAQLLLKAGMERIGYFNFSWGNLIPIGFKVALNPEIVTGLFCYVFSVIVWLLVLSRVDVSFAYPMISIGYIITAIAGYYLFDEHLTLTRIVGILIIIVGVYLITRS